MRLWDRMLARADGYNEQMYTGAVQVGGVDAYGRDREGAIPGVVRTAQEAMAANGIVFGCMAARVGLFSEVRFQFQRLADQSLFGDKALSLLEHPWPNGDTGDLLGRVEQDGGTTAGNAYIRRVAPRDDTDQLLVRMAPATVTIISEERNDDLGRPYKIPVGYMQDMNAAYGIDIEPQLFSIDEVAHYTPLPDPWANWRGMSWLTSVIREVRADHAMTTYKISHLDQGAFPGIIVKSPRKMSNTAIEVLRKRFNTRYGGPENAGRTIVLDEGLDATVAGHSLEQLQADLVVKAGERRIASAAGVPLEVLGLESGDYQAAIRRMADMWARQAWHKVCAALEHLLPPLTSGNAAAQPETPVRLWYDVSGIAALREGELSRGQTTLVKSQAVAAFVQAGFTRKSSVLAAESGDLGQLVPDPNAPTPGMAGRVTETEKLGQGQGPGPGAAPGGPGGGALNGAGPQAGKPQALPGVGNPHLPAFRPGTRAPMPLPPGGNHGRGGARGPGGGMTKRTEVSQ